jgi:hypothetical protein
MDAAAALVVRCIYTRHHDGFVRRRHLERLLEAEVEWTGPFVFQLLGEYVVEILLVLRARQDVLQKESFVRFAGDNPRLRRAHQAPDHQLLGLLLPKRVCQLSRLPRVSDRRRTRLVATGRAAQHRPPLGSAYATKSRCSRGGAAELRSAVDSICPMA